jgi:hypothetical protein
MLPSAERSSRSAGPGEHLLDYIPQLLPKMLPKNAFGQQIGNNFRVSFGQQKWLENAVKVIGGKE